MVGLFTFQGKMFTNFRQFCTEQRREQKMIGQNIRVDQRIEEDIRVDQRIHTQERENKRQEDIKKYYIIKVFLEREKNIRKDF